MSTEYTFYVQSMVASRTGQPAVTITVNGADFTVNLSATEARALAANLLQAAEAATVDAFLVHWLRGEIRANDQQMAAIVTGFREWRESNETP